MRSISEQQRRALVVRRHLLDGGASGPDEVAAALVGLHATDPASVYLAVLARCSTATVDDVAGAMYERRSLVRWLAMRRTLFVFPTVDVPMVQVAASAPVATGLRTRLVNRLGRNGTDPALHGDLATWVDEVADSTVAAARRRGSATGAELSAGEPRLRTSILPRARSDRPQTVTSSLLAMVSAQGRLVRGTPTGKWTSRQHRWEPVQSWWPDGLPLPDAAAAESELARRYLLRFGPATVEDVQWWTGWSKATVGRALATLPVEEVELHGRAGIALDPGLDLDVVPDEGAAGVATLLPALDPTAMGWRHRDWYCGIDPGLVYDRAGNIGPTVWWNGEIVGAWGVAANGEVRTACVVDRGAAANTAVAEAAATLRHRLAGTVITPAIRTPLEQSLTAGER